MNLAQTFRVQSEACAKLGSPFMGRLMGLFADRLEPGSAVADHILGWEGDPGPGADSVPLRLAGALHGLKLDGLALAAVYPPHEASDDALWQAVSDALLTHEARILDGLSRAPQTNEVRRSAVVLAALAEVAARYPREPVNLFELGCSGGLNLLADRYRAELPGRSLGPKAAPVVLRPEWSGPLPPEALPKVIARRGVDIAPLDPARDRLRFLSYLWPDQPERLALTEAALALAKDDPPAIDAGDAGDWLGDTLDAPHNGLTVVFHTVAWQYFPEASTTKARAAMAGAGPLVQIAMENDGQPPGAGVTLTHWPEGRHETLGRADFHGRWIRWN